ncbi:268_t:CDS:10 [Ambispora leptoticha]|uniref:268_t:CDS:1 n=1 Tax=Ambispora leptoticha TaxID=144679 RepID=A0A9N8ZGN4_9GLOM|nr:268_t:CDS:10 [Ambispora leptoticha]
MHKIHLNFKIIFIIILGSLLLLLTNVPGSNAAYNVSYTEELDGLVLFNTYIDRKGVTLIRLLRGNSLTACNYTDEPSIHLRIIHPTGEIDKIDLPKNTLNISRTNFCPNDYILFSLLEPNYIIFTFWDFGDQIPLPNATYEETGVILSYTGEVISTFSLGQSYILKEMVTVSLNPAGGFIRTYIWPNNTITWMSFTSPDEHGTVHKLGEGVFYVATPQETGVQFQTFSLLDGGYGTVIVSNNSVSNSPTNALNQTYATTWTAYMTFLWDNVNTPSELFIIYQTTIPWSILTSGPCHRAYDGTGFSCFLTFAMSGLPAPLIYSVNFLSGGSLTSIQKLQNYDVTNYAVYSFYDVFAGGHVVIGFTNQTYLLATFYNTTGLPIKTYNLGDGTGVKLNIFQNENSLLYMRFDRNDSRTWRVNPIPLPTLKQYDERYYNPNINSTQPTIDDVIELRSTSCSIIYNAKVLLGSGNVTIYQKSQNGDLFREQTQYKTTEYLPDSGYTKVSFTALKSTFNVPGAAYYIVVDTNFVQLASNKEPLIGIDTNVWTFKTGNYNETLQTDSASGLIRLTANGSDEFIKAYENYGNSVLRNLSDQIAAAIPVSRDQINIHDAYQYDQSVTPPRILLRMYITYNATNKYQDVSHIIEDFATLLANIRYTMLSQENYTAWLDSSYNFQVTGNLWSLYKMTVILASAIICAVIVIYLYAVYRNKDAKNFMVITVALIIQDFFFDVLFVFKNGRDFQELFIPSILSFIIPIVFNSGMASYILLSENSREDKFNDWFRKYPQVAAMFTLAACADVDILNVLSSRIDLPQFIIRVLYWRKNITYSVIPVIALISAGVSLLTTIVGRLYQGIIRCKIEKRHTMVEFPVEKHKFTERPVTGSVLISQIFQVSISQNPIKFRTNTQQDSLTIPK